MSAAEIQLIGHFGDPNAGVLYSATPAPVPYKLDKLNNNTYIVHMKFKHGWRR